MDSNELFIRFEKNPILTADDWPYCVNSVFNAGAAKVEGYTLLLVRFEDRRGFSHLIVTKSKNGIDKWKIDKKPTLKPDPVNHPEETWGIEDPHITYLEGQKKWAVVYTSFSIGGPLVSIATTDDFCSFNRLEAVLLQENKDASLFPTKFDGRFALLHRPSCTFMGVGHHIWLSFSPDLKHLGDNKLLMNARQGGFWDANKIGLSPPPLRTNEGWLILYHGVRNTVSGDIYRLGLALLDLEDPSKVLHRSDEWVFGPKEQYEREGDVGNIVFPCGWVEKRVKPTSITIVLIPLFALLERKFQTCLITYVVAQRVNKCQ